MAKREKKLNLLSLDQNHRKHSKCVNPPLYKSSTLIFKTQKEFEELSAPFHTDKTYGRAGTETVKNFENVIAKLENAYGCIAVSSGMNAVTLSLIATLKAGDHALITDGAYKCTKRFVEEELLRLNIEYEYFSPEISKKDLQELVKKNTRVLLMESPSSGTYEIHDINGFVEVAKKNKITTIFDNSWATPLNFKPLDSGINISVQSATKYISGHSDIFLGTICCDKKFYRKVYRSFLNFGTITSPDNCHIALRSLKTLQIRLKEHQESSLKIAKWLNKHKSIDLVTHPALDSSIYNKEWKKYFRGANGTFSFFFKKKISPKMASKFINQLKLFKIGLSWGGFESLVHLYNLEDRLNIENYPNFFAIRLHVGLENTQDLLDDLDKALNFIKSD